jgi:3-oxoadipate enol-lactonase
MRFRPGSGLGLRYKTRGAGRIVVLLHPVGLRAEFWDPVVAELENSFRLIAPDARGHGESDWDGKPFSLDDLAGDVIGLLRAVGGAPAVLVGCSMGGMVAQGVALQAPDLAAGVVVANTTHTRTDQGRGVMEQRAIEAAKGMPIVLQTTLSRWFSNEVQRSQPDIVERARAWLLEADPIVHSWSWRAIRDLNYGERLKDVRVPALAIGGTDDQSAAPSAVEAMSRVFPHGTYREMEGVGHLSPLEQPARFAAHLREFIGGLPDAR